MWQLQKPFSNLSIADSNSWKFTCTLLVLLRRVKTCPLWNRITMVWFVRHLAFLLPELLWHITQELERLLPALASPSGQQDAAPQPHLPSVALSHLRDKSLSSANHSRKHDDLVAIWLQASKQTNMKRKPNNKQNKNKYNLTNKQTNKQTSRQARTKQPANQPTKQASKQAALVWCCEPQSSAKQEVVSMETFSLPDRFPMVSYCCNQIFAQKHLAREAW